MFTAKLVAFGNFRSSLLTNRTEKHCGIRPETSHSENDECAGYQTCQSGCRPHEIYFVVGKIRYNINMV
jgi:hypothetical protein